MFEAESQMSLIDKAIFRVINDKRKVTSPIFVN